MGINTGWGGGGASSFDQITGQLAIAQIDATGTPGDTNYLRGDGAWSTGGVSTQHGRYSNGLKGTTFTDVIRFPTAIGTPDSDVTHDTANVTANGSIFTVVTAGWYLIEVILTITSSDTFVSICADATATNDPAGKIIGTTHLQTAGKTAQCVALQYLPANHKIWVTLTPGKTLTDLSASNQFFNRIFISRIAGPGATGATGPQGPAGSPTTFLDGSLSENAAVAQITGITGRKTYTFTARGVSNANTNRIFFSVNADTTETFTSGRQLVNATSYSPSSDTLLLASTISSGAAFEVRGTVSSVFDGTNTQIYLNCTGYAGGDAFRYMGHKQISGDVDLTSFAIRSNQANGLKSGFYLKAQEAP